MVSFRTRPALAVVNRRRSRRGVLDIFAEVARGAPRCPRAWSSTCRQLSYGRGGAVDGGSKPVKIGLHISDFTFTNGPSGLAEDLTRVVSAAEDAGFARVSV